MTNPLDQRKHAKPGAEAKALIREFLADTLPIIRLDLVDLGRRKPMTRIPTVFVDTSARPDVRDWIRVHQFQLEGDTIIEWQYLTDGQVVKYVACQVTVTDPVDLLFRIAFHLPEYQAFLHRVALGLMLGVSVSKDEGIILQVPSPLEGITVQRR